MVTAIIVIITSLILIRQGRFDSSTIARSLSYSIALSIRQAQVYGVSVRGVSSGGSTTFAQAYGVYFSSADKTHYYLFADLNNDAMRAADGSEDVKVYTIGNGQGTDYLLGTMCAQSSVGTNCSTDALSPVTSLTILFHRPNSEACIETNLTPNACLLGLASSYSNAYIQLQAAVDPANAHSVQVTSTGEIAVQSANTAAPSGSGAAPTYCPNGLNITQYPTCTCPGGQVPNGAGGCVPPPVCGNGVVESGEACDAGASNGSCPASCSSSCTVNSCSTLLNGLVSYWKLDGSAADSVGSNNGTLSGSPTWTTGKINGALSFSGSSQYADMGTKFPSITSAITISAWVNPGSSQIQYADIWGDHQSDFKGMVMQQNSNTLNQYSWGYGNGSNFNGGTGFFNLTSGTWTHVVAVKDATTCYVYINGVEQTSLRGTCTSAIVPATSINYSLGRGYAGGGRFFNGKIDEVAVWNRALSASEVSQLYNSGAGRQYPFSP